jgi:hypothetical protein
MIGRLPIAVIILTGSHQHLRLPLNLAYNMVSVLTTIRDLWRDIYKVMPTVWQDVKCREMRKGGKGQQQQGKGTNLSPQLPHSMLPEMFQEQEEQVMIGRQGKGSVFKRFSRGFT